MTERATSCGPTRDLQVLAASCSGLMRLTLEIGTPLVCLRVARDPEATLAGMNDVRHGAGALGLDGVGLVEEGGWADWAPMPFEASSNGLDFDGVALVAGSLRFALPDGVSEEDFEASLLRRLGRFRYDFVAGWTSHGPLDGPLQAPIPLRLRTVGSGLIEDLFVLDPTRQTALVACHASLMLRDLRRLREERPDGF